MTRFLHTSDWQLGQVRHYLSPRNDGDDPQARFTQACLLYTSPSPRDS